MDRTEPSFHQFEQAILNVQEEYMERLAMIRNSGTNDKAYMLICGLDRADKASMYEFD